MLQSEPRPLWSAFLRPPGARRPGIGRRGRLRAGQDQAENKPLDRAHRIGLLQIAENSLEAAQRGDGPPIYWRVSGASRREQHRQGSDDGCLSSHTDKTAQPAEKLAARGYFTKLDISGRF